MADAFSPPSPPPAPSPLAAEDLADARLAPWPLSPWPAPRRDHGGGGRVNPLFTILPVSALAIGLVLLVAVAVILVVTRRARLPNVDAGGSCNGDDKPGAPTSSCGSHNTRCSYAAAGAGCIYAGRLGFSAQPRSRGAQVFTYRELERATDGFSEGNVVGRGAYGAVFRGRLADGTPAAIKRLRLDHRRQGEREFRIEVDLLSRMDSPYLVGLLGYCADQSHRLLVFEFMPNGSLKSHLHPPRPAGAGLPQRPPLDWQTRLGIALDCARALEFLHEHSSPAVIHRDFNCSNVLLDHNYRARVSDFGMAKVGSNKADGQVVTRVLGTTGYLAPEYASTGKLTTKSDVYSYGVVLLELLTGRVPVDTQRPPGQHVLVSWVSPSATYESAEARADGGPCPERPVCPEGSDPGGRHRRDVHPDEGGVPAADDGRGAVADPHRQAHPGHVLLLHAAQTGPAARHLHELPVRRQGLLLVVVPVSASATGAGHRPSTNRVPGYSFLDV